MSVHSKKQSKTTILDIAKAKQNGRKLSMLTAYDYTMAQWIDQAGVDMILVGDSAANVMAGYESTVPMRLDYMIYHAQSVVRGVQHAFVVCDMPFGTYQGVTEKAFENAVRIMQETGVSALKLEGGQEIVPVVELLVRAGIPVMGHLGLTPQHIHSLGGYGLRAKEENEQQLLLDNAVALQNAGAFALVLEKIPAQLAQKITATLQIPVIGIGAGVHCDGQVLVTQDMLGMNMQFTTKFVRIYAEIGKTIQEAVNQFHTDVQSGNFPSEQESY